MSKKSKKPKISKTKTKNIEGGKRTKGKKTKSKNVVAARKKLTAIRKLKDKNRLLKSNGKAPEHEESTAQDVLDMLDNEQLSFIRGADHIKHQYVFGNAKDTKIGTNGVKRKRKPEQDDEDLENKYEKKYAKEMESAKAYRVLLPVKTKRGFEERTVDEEELQEAKFQHAKGYQDSENAALQKMTKVTPMNQKPSFETEDHRNKVISTAMLLAQRKQKLAEYKMKIGILSASFLEDPENRMKNLDSLLAMMQTNESAVSFSVPKLASISLLTVFQDALPAYAIKHTNKEGVKLKKETRELQGQESNLLRKYKLFLQKLEKTIGKYLPRKKVRLTETETKMGLIALDCMCKMLVSHPYFNLATNIVNFVVPFLNHWDGSAREIVFTSIKTVFRLDKRGEISYEIVRRINVLVKSKIGGGKNGQIKRQVIDVLLGLRIKEADLEREKKDEMKPKGKMSFEERRMLSKRQRKKAKEMVQLERELLEASAEENKSKKSHFLTEITKIVFTIYFRALKSTPNPVMLSAVLEGLAKFAHIINVDFFEDLLKVLAQLQTSGNLKQRQSILCVATVLAVLDGQGSALTLDPSAFHKSLYRTLIDLKCGKPESDMGVALRCIRLACGRRKMPGPRATAFAKRLATVVLQLEHHDALASLVALKQVLRIHTNATSLLDSDGSLGSGVYLPELEDPDHCEAQATTLWELSTLLDHYHPWVTLLARGIAQPDKVETLPKELTMKNPEDLSKKLDPYETMEFLPDLNPPRQQTAKVAFRKTFDFNAKTEFFRHKVFKNQVSDTNDSYLKKLDFVQSVIRDS